MEQIKDFVYTSDSSISHFENLQLQNCSTHNNIAHQELFKSIDEFAKRVVRDLHNSFSTELFQSNQLNIISDEMTIENLILSNMREQGHKISNLNNPEMIYRAFSFIRPSNLLPLYKNRLYLIKQLGVTESGKVNTYVLNPYFFGFKICFDIFVNSLFCPDLDGTLEAGLVKILADKYGSEYEEMYEYVNHTLFDFANDGKNNGDKKDETFIAGVMTMSGISHDKIFYDFIYESAMITAASNAEINQIK